MNNMHGSANRHRPLGDETDGDGEGDGDGSGLGIKTSVTRTYPNSNNNNSDEEILGPEYRQHAIMVREDVRVESASR